MMDDSAKTLELLQIAENDNEVRASSELFKLIVANLKAIEADQEYTLLCAKLSKSISRYSLTHQFKIPDSINNLAKQIEPAAEKYRGGMSIGMWASKFF